MRGRLVIACVIVTGVVVGGWPWLRSTRDEAATVKRSDAPRSEPAAISGEVARSPLADAAAARAGRGVRRLSVEERRALASRIAEARARVRATSGGGASTAPADDTIALEQVSGTVQDALEDAIPILAACYDGVRTRTQRTAAVQMTMYSDPDVGTVIDTQAMTDPDGKPLAPELDDCLRTAIESLALPPLETGGRLPLQYSFVFD